MKILVAMDSFKGCMTAQEACQAVYRGIKKDDPHHEVTCFPMADGGEGTASIFAELLGMPMVVAKTQDAYGRSMQAFYAFDGHTAIMDVASVIGLAMVERDKRNPFVVNTYGVGLMMQDAIKRGAKRLVIGLGGSSTNEGGMGLLASFGVTFYDKNRQVVTPNLYGMKLLSFIDKTAFQPPKGVEILVACDVKNPLLGPTGATYTFGRQKGLFPNQLKMIDGWMKTYHHQMEKTFHVQMNRLVGSGAAGGLGAVLLGVFGGRLVSCMDLLCELGGLDQYVAQSDLIITGEGQTDKQTAYGKVPAQVLSLANVAGVATICLSGALGKGYEALYEQGMLGIFASADRAMTFHQALSSGSVKLEALAYNVVRSLNRYRR